MAGSIEKRGKESWRLTVSAGIDSEGNQIRIRKTIKAKSKREAEKELAKMVTEIEKGQFVEPTKLTFADFVERWIEDYAKRNLAPKTLHRYIQILQSRILPVLGHIKVEQIKPVHLLEFYSNLTEEGIRLDGKAGKLSDTTIQYHHRVLSSIFQSAVQWQVIYNNPCSRVKPPKVKKRQSACYNEQQTADLLRALENEPLKYKVIVILALSTGLRRGELMGLEWSDINFKSNTLEVKRTSQYVPGIGVITKEPKTETSKRVISIPESVMSLLKKYKSEQAKERLEVGDLWQGSDRLFTTWDGRPMHPDTISGWFPELLNRNGLPRIPFHGLRHTAATLLIGQGVHAKTISSRLGHSSISTTMNIYGHALRSADREAADKIDSIIRQSV